MEKRIEVHKLKEADDCSTFNCGDPSFNEFIKKEAIIFQKERFGDTYIFREDEKLFGYVTLCMSAVQTTKVSPQDKLPLNPEFYPSILLGRLAIDKRFEGKGYGRILIKWILGKAFDLSETIACRCVNLTVDRNKKKAIALYENFGFKHLVERPNRREIGMFFDLKREGS